MVWRRHGIGRRHMQALLCSVRFPEHVVPAAGLRRPRFGVTESVSGRYPLPEHCKASSTASVRGLLFRRPSTNVACSVVPLGPVGVRVRSMCQLTHARCFTNWHARSLWVDI